MVGSIFEAEEDEDEDEEKKGGEESLGRTVYQALRSQFGSVERERSRSAAV